MHRRIRLLSPLIALALLLAACGDDGDTSTAAGDVASEAEKEAEDVAQDVIADELDGDCAFLGKFAGSGLDETMTSDPMGALTEGGDALGALADEFQEVADAAPDEIRDAFRTMADGMAEMAEAFADVDFSDPSSIDPRVFEQLEGGASAEFEAAADEVDAWVNEHCPGLASSAG